MSLNIRKLGENLGEGGICLTHTQGFFRCSAGTNGILARVAVIPLVELSLREFQQPLSFSHFTGGSTCRARLLGSRDSLSGIAHILHRCASACTQRQYDDQCGKPWDYWDFVMHLKRRGMIELNTLLIKLTTSHGTVKHPHLVYSDVATGIVGADHTYAKSHNLA